MSRADERLEAYLLASDDHSEEALTLCCSEVLLPICQRVVRSRLWRHDEDVQDVVHDVLVRLIRRLREVRTSGDASSLRDATLWAMGAASKACSDFLRKEHPVRTHLAISLRYRFQKSVAFPLWKASNGRMVSGWHRCRAVAPLSEPAFQKILALPRVSARLAGIEPVYSVKLWRALARLFACANGPIYFQSLISALLPPSVTSERCRSDIAGVTESASEMRADDLVLQRSLLGTLWEAIMTMPSEERRALLLNLRGPEGLAVWWQLDVVSRGRVAEALGLPIQELDGLPLSDLEIAAFLKLDEPNEVKRRQYVINLRRAAKRRLSEYLNAARRYVPAR